MSFEQNLQRLEAIAAELGNDGLALNDALQLFEEGIALLREASKELLAAESKVKLLVEEADGAVSVQELDR